jgi:hypothetical protein
MRVLAVTLIVLLSGCSLFENEQTIPDEIAGQWQWVRSTGGFVGQVIEADSVDYSQSLKIFQDNRAVWYKDREMLMSYRLDPKTEDGERRFVMHPQLKNKAGSEFILTILGVKNGVLQVMDDCMDCYMHSFVKQ